MVRGTWCAVSRMRLRTEPVPPSGIQVFVRHPAAGWSVQPFPLPRFYLPIRRFR